MSDPLTPVGPLPYHSYDGDDLSLYASQGRNVALLTASAALDPEIVAAILDALDRAYDVYVQITGGEPTPYLTYNGQLDGGAGYDRLYGGVGNDTYIVSDSRDYAIENAGEGTDRVYSSITLGLRANIELLTLTGTDSINGYGNGEANILVGNGAGNVLKGGAGNDKIYGEAGDDVASGEDGADWIEGGAGRDRMYGGAGSDRFVFREGDLAGAPIIRPPTRCKTSARRTTIESART